MMNMTTTSMEALERHYNIALQLHDLMFKLHNVLNGTCKHCSKITQEIIYNFKKKFNDIQKESTDGFLVREIIQLTSWLINISDLTEALEVCEERMEYLDKILSSFNPSSFQETDATAGCNGNCKCANHGK